MGGGGGGGGGRRDPLDPSRGCCSKQTTKSLVLDLFVCICLFEFNAPKS